MLHDVVVFLEGLQATGWSARAMYALVFLAANVLFVPASGLSLFGGYWLGFGPAALITACVRPTAAVVGYGLARGVFRRKVARALASRPGFAAVDRALAQGGLHVVVLLRLSPVFPSTLTNYALGLSRVGLADFALGSAAGTLPSTLLYTYLGSGLHAAVALLAGTRVRHPAEYVLMFVGFAATALMVFLLVRGARRELAAMLSAVEEGNAVQDDD